MWLYGACVLTCVCVFVQVKRNHTGTMGGGGGPNRGGGVLKSQCPSMISYVKSLYSDF
jgi:hypothetical protein